MRRQDAARLDQPVNVVRRRLPADEDDGVARLAALLRGIGVEHDLARCGARGGVQPLRGDLDVRIRVDHRMEQLVELARVDPGDRLLRGDQALADHLDRDPERRRRGALPGAGLQQEELPLLDRELDVLHVAVVLLEPLERRDQLVERRGQPLAHRARSARACGCPRRRPRPAR